MAAEVRPLRIIVEGDSNAAGYPNPMAGFATRLGTYFGQRHLRGSDNELRRGRPYYGRYHEVTNFARAGKTSAQIKAELRPETLALIPHGQPGLLLLGMPGADAVQFRVREGLRPRIPVERTVKNFGRIVTQKCATIGLTPLLLDMPAGMRSVQYEDRYFIDAGLVLEYNRALVEKADELGVRTVSADALLKPLVDDGGAVFIEDDGFHLTAEANAAIYEGLLPIVLEELGRDAEGVAAVPSALCEWVPGSIPRE